MQYMKRIYESPRMEEALMEMEQMIAESNTSGPNVGIGEGNVDDEYEALSKDRGEYGNLW